MNVDYLVETSSYDKRRGLIDDLRGEWVMLVMCYRRIYTVISKTVAPYYVMI